MATGERLVKQAYSCYNNLNMPTIEQPLFDREESADAGSFDSAAVAERIARAAKASESRYGHYTDGDEASESVFVQIGYSNGDRTGQQEDIPKLNDIEGYWPSRVHSIIGRAGLESARSARDAAEERSNEAPGLQNAAEEDATESPDTPKPADKARAIIAAAGPVIVGARESKAGRSPEEMDAVRELLSYGRDRLELANMEDVGDDVEPQTPSRQARLPDGVSRVSVIEGGKYYKVLRTGESDWQIHPVESVDGLWPGLRETVEAALQGDNTPLAR